MTRRTVTKLATVGLAAVILLLAGRTCASEAADITIRFARGDAPALSEIRATLVTEGGEPVARFVRRPPAGDASAIVGEWTLQVDPGRYDLELELTTEGGEVVRDRRDVLAEARATITIDLSRPF